MRICYRQQHWRKLTIMRTKWVWLVAMAAAAAPVEFNRDVRPILSDRCFACHGPDKASRKSALRLDVESNAKSKQASGKTAIVPGDPSTSEIIRRVTSTNKTLRMPPAYLGHDALPASEIDVLQRWINEGAAYQAHWSLIPPKKSPLADSIDGFIRARLEREGLKPSPEADRATLVRRVSLDLTGLPPSEEDLKSNEPYEKIVDRLLVSPRYAERMAIRWLEAARYADTNGYQTDGPRDMWRWRDWVIDAFHRNMPFDQFTVEQIAGDLLPNATMQQRLATGFNRNHRTSAEGGIVDEEFRVDYVADRAETTSTVWMGLTVGCARCHDHKYDPITQKEYYQLFAFFNNVPEKGFVYNFGNEEPYMKAPLPDQQKRLNELDAKVATAKARVAELAPVIDREEARWEAKGGTASDWTVTEGMTYREPKRLSFAGKDFVTAPDKSVAHFDYKDPFTFAARIKPATNKGAILSRAQDYFEGSGHGLYLIDGKIRLHVIFRWTDLGMRVETAQPVKLNEWQHVLVTYDGSMKAAGVHMYVDGKPQELKILFDQCIWPIDSKEPFRIGAGAGLRFQGDIEDVRVYKRDLSAEEAAVVAGRASGARMCFLEKHAPAQVKQAYADLRAAEQERNQFYDTIPTVMVMQERADRRPAFLLKRGAYDAHGEQVQPGVPAALPPLGTGPADRLALARWLVDRGNPLTARVTVNRFWQMLFGTGIVKTVEDFGSQGEWPVHPELLDWLAVEFMDSGWDVKHMMRLMVTSSAYKQSSRVTPELLEKDPENRLLARGPRLRLSPEIIRDQALAWSGLLVEKVGGPSVKPYQPPGLWQELAGGKGYQADHGEGLYRRSLYTYWRRTIAPPSMVTFDSPNRETCVVRESRTNTPLQALNLMNDTIYLETARVLAAKSFGAAPDESGRIDWMIRRILARAPRQGEIPTVEKALNGFVSYYSAHPTAAAEYLKSGESPIPTGIKPTALAPYAAIANLLMNTDEAVTKQ